MTIKFIDSLIKWLSDPGTRAAELGTAVRSAGNLWTSTETQSKLDEKITNVQAGSNVTINALDPLNPIINAQGTGFGDVEGPASSVAGNVPVFSDTSGKAIEDSGIAIGPALAAKADLDSPVLTGVPEAPTATLGTDTDQIATMAAIQDAIDNLPAPGVGDVVGPASAVNERIAVFDGTTGKLIKDAGLTVSGLATAAQGAKADSALQAAAIGSTVQGYDADTAKTDVAQQFSKPQRASATTLTSGTTITPDLADNNDFTLTLGHNGTLANPTNQSTQINQKGTITFTQDGTGGRTLSFGSNWKALGSASAPSINTTAGVTSCIDYHVLSSTVIRYSLRAVGAA
ncbi:hypothetical protein J2Y63_002408 [Shinella sp. BE166]|uniref:hypothetical protein n=1 Tax=Shinella sp. BE166 TaxID=3373918 RepID=UPI003EBB87BF